MPVSLQSIRVSRISGTIAVPGDKSISHRALMLAGMAVGKSQITGLLEGEDVLHTAAALQQMGVQITRRQAFWEVNGVGVGGLQEPDDVLQMGNSGTSTRLLMGLVTPYEFTTFFTGDASLRRRPMQRVITPLQQMGATFTSRSQARLPLAMTGAGDALPITYTLPVASAQVKSAILLAGLHTVGATTVIEPEHTRDHTERMLRHMGAQVDVEDTPNGLRVTVQGYPTLQTVDMQVPGDPSSAAFPMVAAVLAAEGDIMLTGICLNPLRTGLMLTLQEMGADIRIVNSRDVAGETVGDVVVKASSLSGINVPAERAPSMIDEYPILAVAAAMATGTTTMRGLKELRVKESDRLTAVALGLKACGINIVVDGDDLIVTGTCGKAPTGGALIQANLDHRMAMAFLVMGMVTEQPVIIDDASSIQTSFPGFVTLMNGLGAQITPHV